MKRLFSVLFLLISCTAFSQIKENTGWLMVLNNTKLSEKWGTHFDLQLRSGDDVRFLRNYLIRPGVTYFLNKNQNLTLGYLLVGTNRNLTGVANNHLTEHRIWQQFIQTHKLSTSFVSHRFRLEQRFIEQAAGNEVFSQRLRYFTRLVLPTKGYEQSFQKGPFVALQNEVFLNLQNKERLNGSVYDQNRLYLAAGFRVGPKADIEVGYLNQSINGAAANTVNHVMQLALYTRF